MGTVAGTLEAQTEDDEAEPLSNPNGARRICTMGPIQGYD
jgi:hypothetical protein